MFALLLVGSVFATPFIVFDKKISEEDGKVGVPVHVTYNIVNLGTSAATDLRIDDAGIPLEQWKIGKAASDLKWDRLEAGQNITHVFEAVPVNSGNLRMVSSRLKYVSEGVKKLAFSSQVFWFDVKGSRSIGAKANLVDYAIVLAIAFSSIVVPLFVWTMTKTAAPASAVVKRKTK